MKENRLWILALAVSAFSAVILAAQEAKAMSFFLDFTDNSLFPQLTPIPNTEADLGIVEVDIRARDLDSARNLNFTSGGVGILGNGDPNIDGVPGPGLNNNDEILQLNFSKSVRFDAIQFTNVDSNDEFTLRIDGSIFGNVNTDISSNPFTVSTSFGNLFQIAALGGNDNFRIASITGEVIPSPALLPGLLGLGAAALRRRRQEITDA